ncbi:hypothetical protein EDEG_00241 [Edhazardia aedis USNM 41457]|uniref:Uncharacterized protein n=1 Tax=Edhazardia aedis (strain USNM 41457) TaxID=1003232 RepID=J9D5T3_EDHAE|nr:hypothetical protein EDEG_00241 [Edhazardia aedis USNM 41457]|eukprot:EJW03136.1 hypothetical protein EDEG_00241 [Edhazardia aedis USNM 41457]
MKLSTLILFAVAILCAEPLLISLSYGMTPSNACQIIGLRNAYADLENVSELYKMIKTASDVESAYIQTWMGDNQGWVMTRSGKMIPYRSYRYPIYFAFCDQARKPGPGPRPRPLKTSGSDSSIEPNDGEDSLKYTISANKVRETPYKSFKTNPRTLELPASDIFYIQNEDESYLVEFD